MPTSMQNRKIGDLWFNRHSDYFASLREGETLVLEDHFSADWQFPRVFPNTITDLPIRATLGLAEHLLRRSQHLLAARQMMELAMERARTRIGWQPREGRLDYLAARMARKAAAVPITWNLYERVLKRAGTRLLIKEMGCYGPSATLMAVARSLGIRTAEYQHGAVSLGHDAYNVSDTLRKSTAFQQTLPEYFLSYGPWWHDQMNVPVQHRVIGNPHRAAQLDAMTAQAGRERRILLLGDGIDTKRSLDLARGLARIAGEDRREVMFRPHPLERGRMSGFLSDSAYGAIRIDQESDLYQSLVKAEVVISEVSTGLFEAVGLAERIFTWDTAKARFAYPTLPFESFVDAEDLIERLRETRRASVMVAPEAVWAPDWAQKYQQFTSEVRRP